jgi:Kef-type K+ transport system membrane component KefB
MRRILILALLLGGMQLILPLGAQGQGSLALLPFGFLILAAYTVGEMASAVRLPKILGYLVAGAIFGPSILGTVSASGVGRLTPVSQLAIALIAFLAGAELRWEEVKERGVLLLKMMSAELALGFVSLATLIYTLHRFLPFLKDAPTVEVAAFAILFASIAIVHSPAVTMALLTETRAEGPVARTTLGVVLLTDVAVVLFFSAALAVARALVPPTDAAATASIGAVVWEIGGALLVGAALGGAIALYLRFISRELMLFAILIAFFGIEIARVAHVELLLTLLTAGFVSESLSSRGEELRHAMERSAAPIFVVFFALSGAKIDIGDVLPVLPFVLPIALVRGGAIWAGTRLGARWGGAAAPERKYTWMGLVSQAGVAIGLATIVGEAYGEMGVHLRTLLFALIAVNETVGPILFRRALVASGEVAGEAVEEEAPVRGRVAVEGAG